MAAKLKDKIQHALDEGRMMVLGVQVLIGFDLRSVFETNFPSLPRTAQLMKLISLSLLILSFVLLVTPEPEHQLAEHGSDTPTFHRFATRFADAALLPFAAAIGVDFAVAGWQLRGAGTGLVAGLLAAAVALAMWYGIELFNRPAKEVRENVKSEGENEPTPTHDKIRQVLTEARVILPGAQATLGFQLAAMLTDGFLRLPAALKWLHFASLSLLSLTIILLITPAAWHRIVERGEETERFHRLASGFVVAALVPLALGLTFDFYIVSWQVSHSPLVSAISTALIGLLFTGFWFVLALIRRRGGAGRRAPAAPSSAPVFGT